MKKSIFIFLCLLGTIPCRAAIITVDDSGPADFDNIQAAIGAAATGDTVLIKEGTYTGVGNRDIDFLGKAITVRSEKGPEFTVIDCQNLGRGFYFHSSEDSDSRLEGVTIISGEAYDGAGILCEHANPYISGCRFINGSAAHWGGGIYCNYCSPVISSCYFTGNSAFEGGAITTRYWGNTIIENCQMMYNTTSGSGGGVNCDCLSTPTVSNCVITYNFADYYGGGGISIFQSDATITNCTIRGNSTNGSGGGILYWYPFRKGPTITNCILTENYARICGGGAYGDRNYLGNYGDGAFGDLHSEMIITGCTITGNQASAGGAVAGMGHADIKVSHCHIAGNSADDGGGLYAGGWYEMFPGTFTFNVGYADITVSHCDVIGNSADNGGGLYAGGWSEFFFGTFKVDNCTFSGNQASTGGAVAGMAYADITVSHCDIIANSAGEGKGIYAEGWYETADCNIKVDNCTFADNKTVSPPGWEGAVVSLGKANMTIAHCNILADDWDPCFDQHIFAMDPLDYGSNLIVDNCVITGDGWGGITCWMMRNPVIKNCTIAGSSLPVTFAEVESGEITNTIIWAEFYIPPLHASSSTLVSYCDISGSGGSGPGWPPELGIDGGGNIDVFPMFEPDGYHLSPGSPCINTGDPSGNYDGQTDIDGEPRMMEGRVDIGADEAAILNAAPAACIAGGNQVIEATGVETMVTLDGSCSTDPDSTPGTNDDIVSFNWYKVEPGGPTIIGSGEIIACHLPLGEHIIILEVIDGMGASDSDQVELTIQDTTPPDFTLSVTPTVLWPPNHKLVEIIPSWTVSDVCDESPEVSLVSIVMNESDDAAGDGQTGDDIQIDGEGSIYLRAERSGTGGGRIYVITYEATDNSGNTTVQSATVTVPHDHRGN